MMKNMSLVILVAILVITEIAKCREIEKIEIQPSLHNGIPTISGQFPSVVSIITPSNVPFNRCNGVLVEAGHVLTSMQCVLNDTFHLISPTWIQIMAGNLDLFQPTFRRFTTNASQIFPHPQYNPITQENDIAVIRLGQPIQLPHNTIDIAVRNARIVPNGATCSFAGWGASAVNAIHINELQQFIPVPILDRDVCNQINNVQLRDGRLVQESMICAGTQLVASNNVCTGNLGGGLFCSGLLTGILSFGFACANAGPAGIYTQVRFFDEWIQQQILNPILPEN